MMVPASEDEIIKSGVVSFVGVVIVLPEITGAVVSTINDVIVSELLTFPAESVTVIVFRCPHLPPDLIRTRRLQ